MLIYAEKKKIDMALKLSTLIYIIYLFHTTSKVNGAAISKVISECNFDHGLCHGYEMDRSQQVQFHWELNSGETESSLTGPNFDNTKGDQTGQYIFAESSYRLNGDVARFRLSVNVKKNDNLCLEFTYHMYGHTMGELAVIEHAGNREEPRFRLSQNRKDTKWRHARVPIKAANNSFQIIFQSKTSYSFYGDIAIDDIMLSLVSDPCYLYPSRASPDIKPPPTVRPPRRGPDDKSTCGRNTMRSIALIGSGNYRAIGRVIGGKEAKPGEWPWMAMLLIQTEKDAEVTSGCGGTLLGTQWIITAAHCVYGLQSLKLIKVRLGATKAFDGKLLPTDLDVDKVFLHPHYRRNGKYNNDIALLRLKRSQMMDKRVNSICLSDERVPAGEQCYIAGWGKLSDSKHTFPKFLQHGRITLKSHDECVNKYGGITDNMLCAGTPTGMPDTCKFDSGGPLMCKNNGQWSLVGVTSWGHDDGCGLRGEYGVYANVTALQDWVKSVTKYPHRFKALHFD